MGKKASHKCISYVSTYEMYEKKVDNWEKLNQHDYKKNQDMLPCKKYLISNWKKLIPGI